MTTIRKSFTGGAVATVTTTDLGPSGLSFGIAASTGWPDGSLGPFPIVFERGTEREERALCQARSSLTVSVRLGGRGQSGARAFAHLEGAAVEVDWGKDELDELNAHVNDAEDDPHTQYVDDLDHRTLEHTVAQPVETSVEGTPIATRPVINVISTASVKAAVTDDATNEEVDISLSGQKFEGRVTGTPDHALYVPGEHMISQGAAAAVTANFIFYEPIIIQPSSLATSALIDNRTKWSLEPYTSVSNAGTTTGRMRVALYEADENWQPGALVKFFGSVTISATGVIDLTGGQASFTVRPGRYLVAWSTDDGTIQLTYFRTGGRLVGFNPGLGASPHPEFFQVAGSLQSSAPDPGTAWDTVTYGASGFRHHIVWRNASIEIVGGVA